MYALSVVLQAATRGRRSLYAVGTVLEVATRGRCCSLYAVGVVLEVIVESRCERVDAALDHLVHGQLQLLLRQVLVEALLQLADGAHTFVEARQLRACSRERGGETIVKQ